MPKIVVDFDRFSFDEYHWAANHRVACLDKAVQFGIKAEEAEGLSAAQKEIVAFVCNLPPETWKTLEAYLFDYYQSEIYGSIYGGDEVTPPVSASSEIWRLLSEPCIGIPPRHRIAPDCWFAVEFRVCEWDTEHGLAVLYNDRGEPIEVAGEIEHF